MDPQIKLVYSLDRLPAECQDNETILHGLPVQGDHRRLSRGEEICQNDNIRK